VREVLEHRDPVGVHARTRLGDLGAEDAAAADGEHDVGERDLGVEVFDADGTGDGAHHLAYAQPARARTEHEGPGTEHHMGPADQVQRLEPVLVLVLIGLGLIVHHAPHASGGREAGSPPGAIRETAAE